MIEKYKKKGYLNNDFKIFYLKDEDTKEYELHYHDFYKLLIFINGNVSYYVEGKKYELTPNDIILINPGEIHKPIINDNSKYERIIIYISKHFLNEYQENNLSLCFEKAKENHLNLLRLSESRINEFTYIQNQIISSLDSNIFSDNLYQKIKVLECIILINSHIQNFIKPITTSLTVLKIIEYINQNLTENISIQSISDALYLNSSYIMHLFKSETGFTIGKYITEKRLFLVNQYISDGLSITEACYKSGFNSYNAYYSARKKSSHTSFY